jgi:UTP:GlnB (protein PII) uridylyltransferase
VAAVIARSFITEAFPTPNPSFTLADYPRAMQRNRIRFNSELDGSIRGVEVESQTRFSLLLDLARTLFRLRAQILAVHSVECGESRAERLEMVESTGRVIGAARRIQIEPQLLDAVELALGRLH